MGYDPRFWDYDARRELQRWWRDEEMLEREEEEQYLQDQAQFGAGNPLLGRKDNLR